MSCTENSRKKLRELRVIDLRNELEKRGIDKAGVKAVLTDRLCKALEKEGHNPNEYTFLLCDKNSSGAEVQDNVESEQESEELYGATEDIQYSTVMDETVEFNIDEEEIERNTSGTKITEPGLLILGDSMTDTSKEDDDINQAVRSPDTLVNINEDVMEEIDTENFDSKDMDSLEDIGQLRSKSEGLSTLSDYDTFKTVSDNDALKTVSDYNRYVPEPLVTLSEGVSASSQTEKSGLKMEVTEANELHTEPGINKAAEFPVAIKEEKLNIKEQSTGVSGTSAPKLGNKKKIPVSLSESRNLWVCGLSASTKATDLKSLFSKHGKVIGTKVVASVRQKLTRFFGFVTMSSSDDATNCIHHLHRTQFHGNTITVEKTLRDQIISSKSQSAKAADMKSNKSNITPKAKAVKQPLKQPPVKPAPVQQTVEHHPASQYSHQQLAVPKKPIAPKPTAASIKQPVKQVQRQVRKVEVKLKQDTTAQKKMDEERDKLRRLRTKLMKLEARRYDQLRQDRAAHRAAMKKLESDRAKVTRDQIILRESWEKLAEERMDFNREARIYWERENSEQETLDMEKRELSNKMEEFKMLMESERSAALKRSMEREKRDWDAKRPARKTHISPREHSSKHREQDDIRHTSSDRRSGLFNEGNSSRYPAEKPKASRFPHSGKVPRTVSGRPSHSSKSSLRTPQFRGRGFHQSSASKGSSSSATTLARVSAAVKKQAGGSSNVSPALSELSEWAQILHRRDPQAALAVASSLFPSLQGMTQSFGGQSRKQSNFSRPNKSSNRYRQF